MEVAAGTRFGPYEIVSRIGAGGMGEVWRANDTRLGRGVAIKILPAAFAGNAQWKVRFEREAKAIAHLSHPHICALHDVGDNYLVMELLEGQTLADRLRKGPLPLADVIRYGTQIAAALGSAHAQNVIHRDLKPANIMLTKSGAKLLDFGLAKSLPLASSADATTINNPITEEGTLLGTLPYMAPEQLEGIAADARTDIFALGSVLYEMVTGHRAFEAGSHASLITKIMATEPPPIASIDPLAPPLLEHLIRRCLRKDPEERWQSARDVANELEWVADAQAIAPKRPSGKAAWIVAALIALAAGTTEVWRITSTRKVPSRLERLSIALPNGTSVSGENSDILDISSDGRRIVFRSEQGGELFLRKLDESEARPVPGTAGAVSPFFSPDGQWIAYIHQGKLVKIPVSGGVAATICDARGFRSGTWGRDGTIVFAALFQGLQRVSADGGQPVPLTKISNSHLLHRWPSFLPDGDHVVFSSLEDASGDYDRADLMVIALSTGATSKIFHGGTHARYATGHLLFGKRGTLFAAPFDLKTLKINGAMRALTDVLSVGPAGIAHFAVASDGTLIMLPHSVADEVPPEVVSIDHNGVRTPVKVKGACRGLRVSPDGRRIAFDTSDEEGFRIEVAIYDLAHESWAALRSEGATHTPVWSPDSQEVVLSSNANGPFNLVRMSVDESRPPVPLTHRDDWPNATSWSPDGRYIAVDANRSGNSSDIEVIEVSTGRAAPFVAGLNVGSGWFSPDGRWIAYSEQLDDDHPAICIRPFPGPGPKTQVTREPSGPPHWIGNRIYFGKKDGVYAVDVTTEPHVTIGPERLVAKIEERTAFDVTPDGKTIFAITRKASAADITHIDVLRGWAQ